MHVGNSAQEAYQISERHAARLVKLAVNTLSYQSRKVFDEVLRHRLRKLAGTQVRYGYRRLTLQRCRQGWHVNAKRILPVVPRWGIDGANEAATQDGASTADPKRDRPATEPVLEHGFRDRPVGRWAFVPHSDRG